ncbi:MAG: fasciclin domain-containing protein, partial [Actinobacteria bacterium]|nr:fasciclin domain-containing protein [Actinomycetota bacterium]
INQAMITVTDIEADNGVVHVIDAVITQPQSIVDIVVNSPRHETLEAAVIAAELTGALSAEGTLTLFAPTDEAFAALGQETIDALLADPTGTLAEILKYHVVGATALSGDLSDGDTFTTLEGSDIEVTINEDGVFINDAKVVFADYQAPNGVVHVIDAVLTPPTNTVVDIIINSDVHENLEAAVIAAKLDGALSGDGPFTVFAPTDDAFAALGTETIDALFDDAEGALAEILKYHVKSGKIMAGDLSDGQIATMLEGTDAFISLFDGKAYINQAMITVTDIEADNGVVHVIDAVITQPESIVDIVVNSPRHETLEAAVIAAELTGALSAEGTLTLFAPTDDAFTALGQETIDALLADPTGTLAEILKYHVVGATALSGDLSDGDIFTTLEGSDIKVTINEDGIFINDAKVVFADYQAPNGVVHVIDAVITPPTNTVVDIIVNSDMHENLEAAVIAAKLDGAL